MDMSNDKIKYSKQAFKYLDKLHKPKAEKIIMEINKLPNTNLLLSKKIKKLKGVNNLYGLRVNDYRVLFSPEYDIIKIEKILPRGDVYNGIK